MRRGGSPVSSGAGSDDGGDGPGSPALPWSDEEEEEEAAAAEGGGDDYGLGGGTGGGGSGLGAWLRPPPTGAASPAAFAPASSFGRLLASVDGWVTPTTHAWLATPPPAPPAPAPPPPGLPADPSLRASHTALRGALARAVPRLLRTFGPNGGGPFAANANLAAVPRSTLEAALAGVAATFDVGGRPSARSLAVSLAPGEWAVAAAVLAKAASLVACPGLRPWFEGRDGVGRLAALLAEEGCSLEACESLMDVLMGGEGDG